MDRRLIAWARAVKARSRHLPALRRLPALWLFTDHARTPDPIAVIGRLPRGSGVVFRPEGWPDPDGLGARIARACRCRRIVLVVAGDWRGAYRLRAGLHLRKGVPVRGRRWPGTPVTSSAHNAAELRRAARSGARLAFLSPAFPTSSHPGAPALGPLRWSRTARAGAGCAIAALGGISGHNVKRLARARCCAAGAIEALDAGCVFPNTVFRHCHKTLAHGLAITNGQ